MSPVKLSFRHRIDVEPNYDFGLVQVLDPDEDWVTLGIFTGLAGGATGDTVTVVVPDSIRAKYNPVLFRFQFTSDIRNSSADGFYPGDGWSIDNVTVKASCRV